MYSWTHEILGSLWALALGAWLLGARARHFSPKYWHLWAFGAVRLGVVMLAAWVLPSSDPFRYHQAAGLWLELLWQGDPLFWKVLVHGIQLHLNHLLPDYACGLDGDWNNPYTWWRMVLVTSVAWLGGLGSFTGTSIVLTAWALAGATAAWRTLQTSIPALSTQLSMYPSWNLGHRTQANIITTWAWLGVPTVMLFTSGILKETWLMGCLGFAISALWQLQRPCLPTARRIWLLGQAILAIAGMGWVKHYLGLTFAAALLPFAGLWLTLLLGKSSRWLPWLGCALGSLTVVALSVYLMPLVLDNLSWYRADELAKFDGHPARIAASLPYLQPDLQTYLLYFPTVLRIIWLEPLPNTWSGGIDLVILSVENWAVLLLLLWGLSRIYWHDIASVVSRNPLLISLFLFGIIYGVLAGFASPAWGSLARYKCLTAPALLTAVWMAAFLSQKTKR